jgi:5-oxoprolinase (ATP-hydrolysing) subunit B
MFPRILPCGDSALTVEFENTIDARINEQVLALDCAVSAMGSPILETVPTYRSLFVQYDATSVNFAGLSERIIDLCRTSNGIELRGRLWQIPVVYGGQFGVDLEAVAGKLNLAAAEVIERHSRPTYLVYMIGFVPGFAYLGGLDASLALPRRLNPRATTPAGSISIGGGQASVASIAAPSGWHLIGRTPVRQFMTGRSPVTILAPGDRVRFLPIDAGEWPSLASAAHRGELIATVMP